MTRWLRYDVIVLDEVGYVPSADIGAELLFQVIAERAERAIDRDHQPAAFRMDPGVSQSALVQGIAGPNHRPSNIMKSRLLAAVELSGESLDIHGLHSWSDCRGRERRIRFSVDYHQPRRPLRQRPLQ